MKRSGHKWLYRSSPGFTLIEVMVGILIMAATSATMFYGVNYARAESRKIIMQQRALEELRSEMDYWMARILDGKLENQDLLGDTHGTEVVLFNPDSPEYRDEEYFVATIYRLPMTRPQTNPDYDPSGDSPYYHLECYIQWEDHLGDVNGEPMELRMQTEVFKGF